MNRQFETIKQKKSLKVSVFQLCIYGDEFYEYFFRELGEQEALKKQNKNRLENADETAKMVTEELESYK